MIIRDQERIALENARKEQDRQRQEALNYASNIYARGIALDDSPVNAERQMGKMMTPAELEVILKKINSNFHFEFLSNGKKRLSLILPSGEKTTVCVYEGTPMPEYSIFSFKENETLDMSLISNPNIKLSRKDFPESKWGGLEYDPDTGDVRGKGWVTDESATKPGYVKEKILWNEVTRGWRTVLARIVAAGYANPAEVERHVDSANRASWARILGKQEGTEIF